LNFTNTTILFPVSECSFIFKKYKSIDYELTSRVALLLGRFISGVLGQVLVVLDLLDYRGLNWISLLSVTMAAMVSLFLPPVESTRYFHKKEDQMESKIAGTLLLMFFKIQLDFPLAELSERRPVCYVQPADTSCAAHGL